MQNAKQRLPQTRAPSLELASGVDMGTLPPELVIALLEFLDPDDQRRAAAVSRLWYRSAWRAGCSLRVRIVCNRFFPGSKPAVLDGAVQHALFNNRPLSLTLKLIAFSNTHWKAFQAIISSVTASLPVLHQLSVSVSHSAVPDFLSALRQPAPQLREFVLLLEQPVGPCHSDVQLPDDIFGDVAPKLRRLVLDRVPVGPTPVPAFAQVNALQVKCSRRVLDINYIEQFPRLSHLHLAFNTMFGGAVPESFRFGGLRLHKLVIEDLAYCTIIPAAIRSIDIPGVPVFEHIGTELRPDDPLWKEQDLGALNLRLGRKIAHRSKASLFVVPAHGRWRRAYHIQTYGHDQPCPVVALPGLLRVGQYITYLRADDEQLIKLLEAGWPDLAAVRALRVDCHKYGAQLEIWPPLDRGHDVAVPVRRRYVRCPALETLTLVLAPHACSATIQLASCDAALLGGALAQCERGAQERAALVLVGIELEQPVGDALIQTAFSSVRACAHDSSWDRDGGIWDEDL